MDKEGSYVIAEYLEKITKHLRFLADEVYVEGLPQPCLEVSECYATSKLKREVNRSDNLEDVTGLINSTSRSQGRHNLPFLLRY